MLQPAGCTRSKFVCAAPTMLAIAAARRHCPVGALGYEHMFVEDLSKLSGDELERQLAEQAAHVDAGLCRLVELAGECERRGRGRGLG